MQKIRVADFPGNRLHPGGIRRTSLEISREYRRSTLQGGDILLSIRGTAVGVCRVPKELDGANITQDTARSRHITKLRALQTALSPVQEQHEIVRRVEILFKLADRIEKRVGAATKRADKIAQSVLAKAFRGELVPTEAELARREGRDYEPASVLLERIKAEREKDVTSGNGMERQTSKKSRKLGHARRK